MEPYFNIKLKLKEDLKIKKAKIIKLSSDYINKQNFLESLKKIENGEIDIIVGTQIISKGFDFENLRSVFD